ncbi:hypothetical protein TcCL_NonESM12827 [Trypanosoma cruzi]|nr:hypothetical protein TcCL_NonESM12827 [Trypanosoma cruzi]
MAERGLLSALGGSGLCAPCLICECWTQCQSAVRREVKDCSVDLLTPRPFFPAFVCAGRIAISCGATWMAFSLHMLYACAVRRASLPHDTALVCGTVKGVEMCAGVRVAVVSVHLDLQTRGTTRPPLAVPRPSIEKV